MREQLEVIARLLMALPNDGYQRVFLGISDGAYFMLAAIAGAETKTGIHDRNGSRGAIERVEVKVGGIDFFAQRETRPLTEEENARLDREGRAAAPLVTA